MGDFCSRVGFKNYIMCCLQSSSRQHEFLLCSKTMLSLFRRRTDASTEFAERMKFELPLFFSGDRRFGRLFRYRQNILKNLSIALRKCDGIEKLVLVRTLAEIIDTSIETGIKHICTEFETERDYDVLDSRLQHLEQSTRILCADILLTLQYNYDDCGPAFKAEFLRRPFLRALHEVVEVCKDKLVPVIQTRICNEFQQHHDIVATSVELQQFATRFDIVGFSESRNDFMALAAAQTCVLRLLPQLEKTYEATVETAMMSLCRHADHKQSLHPTMTDNDLRNSISLSDKRAVAMQYCRALAHANIISDPWVCSWA